MINKFLVVIFFLSFAQAYGFSPEVPGIELEPGVGILIYDYSNSNLNSDYDTVSLMYSNEGITFSVGEGEAAIILNTASLSDFFISQSTGPLVTAIHFGFSDGGSSLLHILGDREIIEREVKKCITGFKLGLYKLVSISNDPMPLVNCSSTIDPSKIVIAPFSGVGEDQEPK